MTRLPAFDRHRPDSIEEASELLEEFGDDAVVYAGGTELFLLFKFGFAEYPQVIDLKGIDELRGIERQDGRLKIGAAETHRAIERNSDVRRGWPALAAMERGVGNLRVRTMGTIGGNLCFADPHSDPATFLLTLDGQVEARKGGSQTRTIDLAEFVQGPYENALEDGELLTSISVAQPEDGATVVHRKFVLTERPAITVACHLGLSGNKLLNVRLAVGSAGVRASRVTAAEEILSGSSADQVGQSFETAGELVADAADPVEDANGSIEYKRHMVTVLSRRVVEEAVSKAGETGAAIPGE